MRPVVFGDDEVSSPLAPIVLEFVVVDCPTSDPGETMPLDPEGTARSSSDSTLNTEVRFKDGVRRVLKVMIDFVVMDN